MIEEIKKLALLTDEIDYANKQSVKEHNKRVDRIRSLISDLKNHELLELMNEKSTKGFIAFQLSENFEENPHEVKERILIILDEISKNDSLESLPAKWLLHKLRDQSIK